MKNSHLPKTVTKKLKFGSSKKGFDDKYSSESELERPENILHSVSKVPVGSQVKHGIRKQHFCIINKLLTVFLEKFPNH
jgi:hypothetical protein